MSPPTHFPRPSVALPLWKSANEEWQATGLELGNCDGFRSGLECRGMEAVIIEEEALRLPEIERAVLADRLLASLSRRPAELEAAWLREADSRMEALRDGKIETVSGPEAMADLHKMFPR